MALYGEYGLSESWTLLGRVAWQSVEQQFGLGQDRAEGLAASELGVRYRLHRFDHAVLSVQASAFIAGDGENITNQPLGEGSHAAELRLLAGYGFDEGGFADVQLAYRQREGLYLDEARLDLTAGWELSDRWQVMAASHSVWSVEAALPGSPDFSQHKLDLSLLREIGGFEIQLGVTATPAGRNALDERAVFLSGWRRF